MREGGGGIGALEQSSSRMGFVSNPGASHKQPVSHNPPHAWLRTIASFACIRDGERERKPLQIEPLVDSRQRGLRWRCHVFVYLQALCFYYCRNRPRELRVGASSPGVRVVAAAGAMCPLCSGVVRQTEADSHQGHRETLASCHEGDPRHYYALTRARLLPLLSLCLIYFLLASVFLNASHFHV